MRAELLLLPTQFFFALILMILFLHFHTFAYKFLKKKLVDYFPQNIFFWFFSIFLESSETHFDLVVSKIWVKLNFLSKNLSFWVPETWNFVRIFFLNGSNWFCIRFRTLHIFQDQKLNFATSEGKGGGLHVVN